MSLRGTAGLTRRFIGATARVAVDRVGDAFGWSLPGTADALARREVVDALLDAGAPSGARTLPPIRTVRRTNRTFESSNCTNFLVELDYEDGPAGDAPDTLYVKLPCAEFATRAFANTVGFWEIEATFCERVASQVTVRVPRVHAVARRGSRFVLLLEDLGADPTVRCFINRDMAAGTTVERARRCLTAFAELHAGFWNLDPASRDATVPWRLHTYLSPGGRARTRALNALAAEPAHRAAPDRFDAAHLALFRRALDRWDPLVDAWYREPLTLIHGDSHLANCFEYGGGDDPRVGLLDFQGMHWCHGMRDVQYFLSNSLEPDLLAPNEAALVDHYLAELRSRGVDIDEDDALLRYRAFAFQTWMVAVTSIGLGGLTERTETVRTILERSTASIDRLRFAELLETL